MASFQSGGIQVLVTTTVLEVGIDVPEASVLVVEHAERFGLSQLHQLRGRVGRGSAPSWCILIPADEISAEAEARLRIICETEDGFEISRKDLELRGPGELGGFRQAGDPGLKVADLVRDGDLLELARREAQSFCRESASSREIQTASTIRARRNSQNRGSDPHRIPRSE